MAYRHRCAGMSMAHQQRGIVLLITLLLLGVLSALMLAQLEMLLLYQKASQQWLSRLSHHHGLEQLALRLIQGASSQNLDLHCVVTGYENPNRAIAELKTTRSCHLSHEGIQYTYILEDLGLQPCWQAVIQAKNYNLQDRRLTLSSEAYHKEYLQIRFASLAEYHPCLNLPIRAVMPGILSWRLGFVP